MPKSAVTMNSNIGKSIIYAIYAIASFFMVCSCTDEVATREANAYNDKSYAYHYRDLDSTLHYGEKALQVASVKSDDYAEALNNIAFYYIAKMRYGNAKKELDKIPAHTDNQLELMICNVQQMRLCQRKSDNKNFYHYLHNAQVCLRRIMEDADNLSQRQRRRFVYAQTEYWIVFSTYLYYIGQPQRSSDAIFKLSSDIRLTADTAQMLAFYYNVGSGGMLIKQHHQERINSEFDYLLRCYVLSRQYDYPYWEANSLQAISEHLQDRKSAVCLFKKYRHELAMLNKDNMPDSLLAGNLAQRALDIFNAYGDVYQTAGAWRTLSEAFGNMGDYPSALICLDNALNKDTLINRAPDLVASIREQMSITYSLLNDKQMSDYNRNIYLDIQEHTRQDRQLEARVEQLTSSLHDLDVMIFIVILTMVGVMVVIAYLYMKRRKESRNVSVEFLKEPLARWIDARNAEWQKKEEDNEALEESIVMSRNQCEQYEERNIEQRAKVALASSIAPLISRMLHEVRQMARGRNMFVSEKEGLEYVYQLATSIEDSNRRLTDWIQLRKGNIRLHVESFRVEELFDTLKSSDIEYRMKGISLIVVPTDAVVKADKALTLFMLNTISENAKRYTNEGGRIVVYATASNDNVEISIKDDGCGMSEDQLRSLFTNRMINDGTESKRVEGGHGFGLVNCKGIIEQYRKISSIFKVCLIGAESKLGEGSRVFFRLPLGVMKSLMVMIAVLVFGSTYAVTYDHSDKATYKVSTDEANRLVDSLYTFNIKGEYRKALEYSDSCVIAFNVAYSRKMKQKRVMVLKGDYPDEAAELKWHNDGVNADYKLIMALRNETAVAALALHDIDLYNYNNQVYTKLFRECSADNTLSSYVKSMQKAEGDRNIAFGILAVLLISVFPAYYFLYYRHRMYYRLCVDKVNAINDVLLSPQKTSAEKLNVIKALWDDNNVVDSNDSVIKEKIGELQSIVDGICGNLREDVKRRNDIENRSMSLNETLRQLAMNRDKLYVANNVLDNCLSSLKHETMFYPSRLKQVIETRGDMSDKELLNTLDEIISFYRTLYSTLLLQVVSATNGMNTFNPHIAMRYLLSILKRKNNGVMPEIGKVAFRDEYVKVIIGMTDVNGVDQRTCDTLLTSMTNDTDFLICRQIMRDIGEYYRARGCGLAARLSERNTLIIEIIIKENIWERLR